MKKKVTGKSALFKRLTRRAPKRPATAVRRRVPCRAVPFHPVLPARPPVTKPRLSEEQKKARRILRNTVVSCVSVALIVSGAVLALRSAGYFSVATVYITGTVKGGQSYYPYSLTVTVYIDEKNVGSTSVSGGRFSFTIKVKADEAHTFRAKDSYGRNSDIVTKYISRGGTNTVSLTIPDPNSTDGYIHVYGYNYNIAQTIYLYIDSIPVTSTYASYSSPFDFGCRKVAGNAYHTVELRDSENHILYSETSYVSQAQTKDVYVNLRTTKGYLYVSGTNYGISQTIYLYLDYSNYAADSEYVSSGSSFYFRMVEVTSGSHTVYLKDSNRTVLNSTTVYVYAGQTKYITLNVPHTQYGYIRVSGTNYGNSQPVYLYIDYLSVASQYVYSGSSFYFSPEKTTPGSHTVQLRGSGGKVLNSTTVYVYLGQTLYLTMNIPPEPSYIRVSGYNYGSSLTVYLYIDFTRIGYKYVSSGSNFYFAP